MKDELIAKMVLESWYSTVKRVSALFEALTEEQIQSEIAPNRNRGIYLLGHLTAVNDMMRPLLGLGDTLHPELKASFIRTPDNSEEDKFTVTELVNYWAEINQSLEDKFNDMTSEDWFSKHTTVSAEDFAKQPHRNKLNVIISRTNHMSYHLGQMSLLKSS
jgi:hypothetical protein